MLASMRSRTPSMKNGGSRASWTRRAAGRGWAAEGRGGGGAPGAGPRGQVGDADDELVAPEPGDRVDLAQRHVEPLGDHAEERVAGLVAERVVDLPEAVEVDEQHGAYAAVPSGLGDGPFDTVAEEHPIGETGQRVV